MSPKTAAPVRIFSARACAAPLKEAADRFTQQTGIPVEISVCNRHCAKPVAEEAMGEDGAHDFLMEIREDGIHDLVISGAEYLLDEGEVRGIVRKGERRLIAYRRSALIVPAGNPARIRTLQDLTRPGVRIGVSVIDCLKGLWEDVTARLKLTPQVRPNITFHANGCVAIVEATAEAKVDVAFGWNTFEHLAHGRIATVELPADQQVWRGTGVGLLSFATQPEPARRFMEFLASPETQALYQHHGWVAP